ncbi:MAG: ACP S-malonyltransferase [Pseudomonadota bacterium]
MKTAFLFPGQGSQAVGMGRDLADAYPEARAVFDEVDTALGDALSQTMFDGPDDQLTLTENAQPALMAVSMAVVRVLEARGVDLVDTVDYVAGHSLGEYSALCAAGAVSIADTARLLRTRGQAMQRAVPVGEGAMAALMGLDFETASAIAAEAASGEVCAAANDNADGQVVLSGTASAVERAIAIAETKGARKAVRLPVSAPFHCALMAPAADVMAEALAATEITAPKIPVIANVGVAEVSTPDAIRASLVEQVTGTVRWRETGQWLAAHAVTTAYEVGAGKVLTGLMRRIDRSIAMSPLGTPSEIDAFLADRS